MIESVTTIFHTLANLIRIGLSYYNFWIVIAIIAAIGFVFYLFLKTPKV